MLSPRIFGISGVQYPGHALHALLQAVYHVPVLRTALLNARGNDRFSQLIRAADSGVLDIKKVKPPPVFNPDAIHKNRGQLPVGGSFLNMYEREFLQEVPRRVSKMILSLLINEDELMRNVVHDLAANKFVMQMAANHHRALAIILDRSNGSCAPVSVPRTIGPFSLCAAVIGGTGGSKLQLTHYYTCATVSNDWVRFDDEKVRRISNGDARKLMMRGYDQSAHNPIEFVLYERAGIVPAAIKKIYPRIFGSLARYNTLVPGVL